MKPPAEMPAVVSIDGLSHDYGARRALSEVTLTIPAGGTTALVGPDGVGKSTLLGIIAGVRRIQSGRVEVLGCDMRDGAARDAASPRIAYMPQGLGRNLYPTLSVQENIAFFSRLYGQGERERKARIARLVGATGLAPFVDRPAGKLSGGMRQKLSLCCALIHDPDLLVLDEPTTGVDPLSRRRFWALIDAIRAERPGMTVVVATAYMEEAERCDIIVAMDAGRVLAQGPTADMMARAGASHLEELYVSLQDPDGSRRREPLVIPPQSDHADGPPAISATHLTRRFGSFVAVDDVSFSIARGEIFGFLGSNGCGKTTTMKMLTGLLGITSGEAQLLGRPVEASDLKTRMRVGYMSQGFSLYEELTVRANLELHARLYRVPGAEVRQRVADAMAQFELADVADQKPPALPLGIRQRLQLAAACLHRPEVLILDEPTSGVDPAARDMFWRLLADLSRRDGVTIFVSTHFMNEAELCDRVSLMHAGRVLAVGTPAEICATRGASDLEEAFIAYLQEADPGEVPGDESGKADWRSTIEAAPVRHDSLGVSFARVAAFARREFLELMRDKVRLAFALLGPLVLMVTFGFGISFDVENLPYAVFDRDQTAESRQFAESFSGSRYFREQSPILAASDIDRRLRAGELRLAIDIPPGFGRDLLRGRKPEVGLILDGAPTFRAETTRGYAQGIVVSYAEDLARRTTGVVPAVLPYRLEPRFRYNQDFRSVFAITPGCIMILLIIIPAMLTALGVVREREIGSISNFAASPASVGEFLIGKQLPYVAVGLASFFNLCGLVLLVFGVSVKGSFPALVVAALLYVFAATALGILISTFVRTQIAAIIATAIITTVPAINFSGYLYPAATLEGAARWLGMGFPSLWFQNVSIGTFAKARDASAFLFDDMMLFGFGIVYLAVASLLMRKQEA